MKPTDKQYRKISEFLSADLEHPGPDDYEIVRFIASDNLLTRSFAKWDLPELANLAKLLPGCTFTLDHDWDSVGKIQGLIFDSYVQELTPDPLVVNAADNGKTNKKIIKSEGYFGTIIEVAFPSFGEILSHLRYGVARFVSIGGFLFKDRICPLCEVSFDDPSCPHIIPDPWWGFFPGAIVDGLEVAPYFVRSQLLDVGEVSLVLIPNLPGAKILSKQLV
jgi:hypothetical protein